MSESVGRENEPYPVHSQQRIMEASAHQPPEGEGDAKRRSATPAAWATTAGEIISRVMLALLAVTLIGDVGVVFANIITREIFGFSILWSQEVSSIALAILTFGGGVYAYWHGQQLSVAILTNKLPVRLRRPHAALISWIACLISAVIGTISIGTLANQWRGQTSILHISVGWQALPLTAGLLLIALLALIRLVEEYPLLGLCGGAVVAVISVLAWSKQAALQPVLTNDASVWVCLIATAVLIAIGLPLALALMSGPLLYLLASGASPLAGAPTAMQSSSVGFVLLAIPFFICAGLLMDRSGVSARLIAVANILVGRMKGGLLQTMVLAMFLFSGISGSKGADVAAVGSGMMGSVRKAGYNPAEGVAVLSASAAMGETIPPSVAMLVLASVTSLSVNSLFIGGIIPAVMLAAFLMAGIFVRSRRWTVTLDARRSLREIAVTILKGLVALSMPVILIGGILTGITTPTEVSAVAIVLGVILAFAYRTVTLRSAVEIMHATSSLVGMVLFMVAAAGMFSWALTLAQIPQSISRILLEVPGGKYSFLVVTVVVMVIMGAIFEGLPALLIFGPLLIPVAAAAGVSTLQYGIVMIVAMGIGSFSPPIGVGLFTACLVGDVPMEKAARPTLYYMGLLVVGLLVITFVPAVVIGA